MKLVCCLVVLSCCLYWVDCKYEPTWASLDQRPIPEWYDEAKFGIFISWGLFSVPSFGDEWFWNYWESGVKKYVDFMKENYRPDWTYPDFANQFTAEFYNPDQWADLLQDSGAKYVVFITKHHDGYTNWPSKVSWNWNAGSVGPRRDLVGDFARSLRNRTDIRLGLYHSLYEWFNPLYLDDARSGFKTQNFVERKTMPELYELVMNYEPDLVWSDGSNGPDVYWNSTDFLAWLYNESPVKDKVVVNDRWGNGIPCHHGDFYTCHDRFNPGYLFPHKWENCMTIDRESWGYRREAVLADYLGTTELVAILVETVSCGGNLLMNVGPTHDGRILPIFEERLRDMGSWLKVNGEAIYGTKPWKHQNDTVTSGVWYTSKNTSVYAITLKWPKDNTLALGAPAPSPSTRVTLLGYHQGAAIPWKPKRGTGMVITLPVIDYLDMPCRWAWVFKLENL